MAVKALLVSALIPGLMSGCSDDAPPAAPLSSVAQTRYPIVLAHGLSGFGEIGPLHYWHGIPEDLRVHGATVFVTQVSAFNASEVRGQQLLRQVEQILAATGAGKVNLIGHSHGTQSVRYVAAMRPELVASVTAIAGPVQGAALANRIKGWTDAGGSVVTRVLAAPVNGLGHLLAWLGDTDLPQDAYAALNAVTSDGAARFNERFPAGVPAQPCGQGAALVNGIRYYSWSGVGQFYRVLNPGDYAMALTGWVSGDDGPNDGLVGRCSSHLGVVIRDDYPMNHLHAINHLFGVVGPEVDPVGLYRAHAQRLREAGL